MEKDQETQIDADILQCRTDILRVRQTVTATVKEESSDAATATTTQVKPTEKNPVKTGQDSKIHGEVKSGAPDKGEEQTKNAIKSGPAPQAEADSGVSVEPAGQQIQNQMEHEAKVSVRKAESEAKAAKEKAEQEAAARAEAQEKVKAEQELKAAAQMAQAEAKAARIKAQEETKAAEQKAEQEAAARAEAEKKAKAEADARAEAEREAKAAAQKAEQEVKARIEAQEKARTEADARAKAEAEAKALAEKARQEATARAEAEKKAKAEADACAKAEQEVKTLVEKIQARTEPETAPEASGPSSTDEKENVKAPGTIFQGEEGEDTENRIPRFNLARQILAEQRKVASTRRGKPMERGGSTEVMPATGTIGQIIREAKKKTTDLGEDDETLQQLSCGVHGIVEGAHNLSPVQRQVIAGIVTLDIARLSFEEGARRNARPG